MVITSVMVVYGGRWWFFEKNLVSPTRIAQPGTRFLMEPRASDRQLALLGIVMLARPLGAVRGRAAINMVAFAGAAFRQRGHLLSILIKSRRSVA